MDPQNITFSRNVQQPAFFIADVSCRDECEWECFRQFEMITRCVCQSCHETGASWRAGEDLPRGSIKFEAGAALASVSGKNVNKVEEDVDRSGLQ